MSEERQKILRLLEEGHITSEEAEKLLNALEKGKAEQEKSKESSNEHQDAFQEFKEDLKSFTSGILNFVDDTIQRVKDGPFEFTFSHVQVKRKFEFHADEINQLNVDLTNSRIEFLPSNDSTIVVQCIGKVHKEDDQERAEEKFDDVLSVGVTNETLHIDQKSGNVSIEHIIYLPEKEFEQAYIKTINGSIKGRSVNLKFARVSTVNGSIRLSDYQGDAIFIESKHGSLRLDEANLSKVKLETKTGSIYYDGQVDYLDVDVTTGSLRTYLHNSTVQRVDLSSTTGSSQLYLPKGLKVKGTASTGVGSIDVNIPEVVVSKMDDHSVKKLVQFYNATDDENYADVDIETKTGSIKVNTLN
ncbi:DUF4097 family beta strand repeat-containing protein [Aquisalibacillus elongatus]|uniref:DUF4097 and DUF4098 domain-containing protein YvlB n=1 Tax=Aquisalibacillus elongatus TaxID=485577 RepID=A0A3N5CBX1_9BACI|nr:DUF4097 family beta strand repeat-containing protein [Aquisalibacillus elongatus]RPF54381.1 DUF4097 and DUF4098 domain-containing protein YvlB [Aquisalibacillus elongatus]